MSDPHFTFIALSYGAFCIAMAALISSALAKRNSANRKLTELQDQTDKSE